MQALHGLQNELQKKKNNNSKNNKEEKDPHMGEDTPRKEDLLADTKEKNI